MPRIVCRTDFVKTCCVAGLEPLKAEKASHSHRIKSSQSRRHKVSSEPRNAVRGNTGALSRSGEMYRNSSKQHRLSIEAAESKLGEMLRGMDA